MAILSTMILKNNNFMIRKLICTSCQSSFRANHLFQNGRNYIVKDDQIIIIDESRKTTPRKKIWVFHQSLEAKEKLVVNAENQTLASITHQNFKLYKKISGCTGTAQTESQKFLKFIVCL